MCLPHDSSVQDRLSAVLHSASSVSRTDFVLCRRRLRHLTGLRLLELCQALAGSTLALETQNSSVELRVMVLDHRSSAHQFQSVKLDNCFGFATLLTSLLPLAAAKRCGLFFLIPPALWTVFFKLGVISGAARNMLRSFW
jgi:hypothetical protein